MPSLTELLASVGLDEEVVACTTFCVHPPRLRHTARAVGGTKDPDLDALAALAPTHILVNREENTPEVIAACQALAPTLVTEPSSPLQVPSLIREVAVFLALNPSGPSTALAAEIDALLAEVMAVNARGGGAQSLVGKRCLYFIWANPWMVVAKPTYIDGMLALCGLHNAAPASGRYPVVDLSAGPSWSVDLLLLSSEPWPFRKRDEERLRQSWPEAPPCLWADGRLFSWYGSSTREALQELRAWQEGKASRLINGYR